MVLKIVPNDDPARLARVHDARWLKIGVSVRNLGPGLCYFLQYVLPFGRHLMLVFPLSSIRTVDEEINYRPHTVDAKIVGQMSHALMSLVGGQRGASKSA